MKKSYTYKGHSIVIEVWVNHSTGQREISNRITHDEEIKTFRKHLVKGYVDGKLISQLSADDDNLLTMISAVEGSCKQSTNQQSDSSEYINRLLRTNGFSAWDLTTKEGE